MAAVPGKILNNFCWIMSTYTMDKHYDGVSHRPPCHHRPAGLQERGLDPPWSGAPHLRGRQDLPRLLPLGPLHALLPGAPSGPAPHPSPTTCHPQAACFYVPHWIWKQIEGGLLENIVTGLTEVERGGTKGQGIGRKPMIRMKKRPVLRP